MESFRDLPPKKDPKGGSPKTPRPTSLSQFQYEYPPTGETPILLNGNGIWKAIATGLGGLLVGMTVAWFTALQYRGVSQRDIEEIIRDSQIEQEKHLLSRTEMHEYVKEYSPWSFDKQAVISRLATQDQNIGELRTKIDLAADVIKKQATTKP